MIVTIAALPQQQQQRQTSRTDRSSTLSETLPQPRRVRAATLTVDRFHLGDDDAGDDEEEEGELASALQLDPAGGGAAVFSSSFDPATSTGRILLHALHRAMTTTPLLPWRAIAQIRKQGLMPWTYTSSNALMNVADRVFCAGDNVVVVAATTSSEGGVAAVSWFDVGPSSVALRSRTKLVVSPAVVVGAFNSDGSLFAIVEGGGSVVRVLEHTQVGRRDLVVAGIDEDDDGLVVRLPPNLGGVAGLGFSSEQSHLLLCTSNGQVYCSLRLEGGGGFSSSPTLLPNVVPANTAQPALADTHCALLAGEKLFLVSAQHVSVLVVHESSSTALPRLIPFQRATFAEAPRSFFSVDDFFRARLGIPLWRELLQCTACDVNSTGDKLALVTGMRRLLVVDLASGRVQAERAGVRACTWFSSQELALVLEDGGALAICSAASSPALEQSVLDSAVQTPTAVRALCRSGASSASADADASPITLLAQDRTLLHVQPCTPEQVLEQKLAQGDFQGALDFCQRKHLSVDLVHLRMFDAQPVTRESIANHLAKITDLQAHQPWMLQTCLDRIPADYDSALALLEFGRSQATMSGDGTEAANEFDSQLARLQAYHTTFSVAAAAAADSSSSTTVPVMLFDPKAYKKFRTARSATDIAVQLANQGMMRELHIFLLETVWGRSGGDDADTRNGTVCDAVSEAVPPREYERILLASGKPAQWFVDRAVDIDQRSGLLRHAVSLMEIGARMMPGNGDALHAALASAQHLVRLVFHLHVDFSLPLSTWLFGMTPTQRIEVCYAGSDLDLFVKRVFPLYCDLPPVQQKPWLAAMQDFLSGAGGVAPSVRFVYQALFNTDLVYRNRVDGRLVVLQVASTVLQQQQQPQEEEECASLFFRAVNEELDRKVEMVMWPKRFAALRAELDESHWAWQVWRACQQHGLVEVTVQGVHKARQERDAGLMKRLIAAIVGTCRRDEEEQRLVHAIAAQDAPLRIVGEFVGLSPARVLALALEQVLLHGSLYALASSTVNDLLLDAAGEEQKAEDMLVEAYSAALRELFLRDEVFPQAVECLHAAPPHLQQRQRLGKFDTLIKLASFLSSGESPLMQPAEVLVAFERNPSELLTRVLTSTTGSNSDVALAVQIAPLLGSDTATIVTYLVQQSQVKQARALVDGLLLSSSSSVQDEEEKFRACRALAGFDSYYRVQAVVAAPTGADVCEMLAGFDHSAGAVVPVEQCCQWVEHAVEWRRCCAAAGLATTTNQVPSKVESEHGCVTLLNSVEIAHGRWDALDGGGRQQTVRKRFAKAFPHVQVDVQQQDPVKRFQLIATTLALPPASSDGSSGSGSGATACMDLGHPLEDGFVLAFCRALKQRRIANKDELAAYAARRPEYLDYVLDKLAEATDMLDVDLKLELVECVTTNKKDAAGVAKRRAALHRLLELTPHVNLKYIELRSSRAGAVAADNTAVLASIAEQMAFCSQPVEFAELAAEVVMNNSVGKSEILGAFMEHVLLGGEGDVSEKEEEETIHAWTASAYVRRCRHLVGELQPEHAAHFARQVCFAAHKLSQDTRVLVLNDLAAAAAATDTAEIATLARLAALPVPPAWMDDFCQAGRRGALRDEFAAPHALELDVAVSQALADCVGYDWHDVLFDAIVQASSSQQHARRPLMFALPAEVERRLEAVQTPELVRFLVQLGVASPMRLREAQIHHLVAAHDLTPPPPPQHDWPAHLAKPGVVRTTAQAVGALEILTLVLPPVTSLQQEDEALLVRLVLKLGDDNDNAVRQWVNKLVLSSSAAAFPPTMALDLVRGLSSSSSKRLAFDVALHSCAHIRQCEPFLVEHVSELLQDEEVVDFAAVFQRVGLEPTFVGKHLVQEVQRDVLAGNSSQYSASCCRLVVEMVTSMMLDAASEIVYSLRKTVRGGGGHQVLALYLDQVRSGIESGKSRLRFATAQERDAALDGLRTALQRCTAAAAVPAPVKQRLVKPIKAASTSKAVAATWEVDLLLSSPQKASTTTEKKTNSKTKKAPSAAWDDDEVDIDAPVAAAAVVPPPPPTASHHAFEDLLLSSSASTAATAPVRKQPAKAEWDADELSFDEDAAAAPPPPVAPLATKKTAKPRAPPPPAAGNDPLDFLMSAAPPATVAAPPATAPAAPTSSSSKPKPTKPARATPTTAPTTDVDSTLAFLLQPSAAPPQRKRA